MRTLGIDLGTRRVGLALSDEGAKLATPLEVIEVSSPEMAAAKVMEVIQEEGVQRLVIGVPLNMDDSIGAAAKTAVEWGRQLEGVTGLPVLFVDERLSSFEAQQILIQRKKAGEKLTRQRKKQQLDAVAAAGFLQAFLDGRITALSV